MNKEWFFKKLEEILIAQILSQLCFNLKYITILLAPRVFSCLCQALYYTQNPFSSGVHKWVDYFEYSSLNRAMSQKYLKRDCWTWQEQQLSIKYLFNRGCFRKTCPYVWDHVYFPNVSMLKSYESIFSHNLYRASLRFICAISMVVNTHRGKRGFRKTCPYV